MINSINRTTCDVRTTGLEATLTPHQTGQQLRDPEIAVPCIDFPSILLHKVLSIFILFQFQTVGKMLPHY